MPEGIQYVPSLYVTHACSHPNRKETKHALLSYAAKSWIKDHVCTRVCVCLLCTLVMQQFSSMALLALLYSFALVRRESHTNCYVGNYHNCKNDIGDASNDDPNLIKEIGISRGFLGIFVSSITNVPPYLQ